MMDLFISIKYTTCLLDLVLLVRQNNLKNEQWFYLMPQI